MAKIADQTYLLQDQYRDASKLDARVRLHVEYSTNKYGWNRWYFDQLILPPEARVLELGCGPGHLWRSNLNQLPADWDITLSDFSAGMVAEARQHLAAARPFHFERIDAQAIPLDAHTFDAVIANHMLYHVPDRLRALREIRRVLKPGGAAYIATNGEAHLRELHHLLSRFSADELGWGQRTPEVFSLDRGSAEIMQVFAHCELRRYPDTLVVTAAAPLVDYILSMADPQRAHDHHVALTDFIQHELHTTGPIVITKDSGIFIAKDYAPAAD